VRGSRVALATSMPRCSARNRAKKAAYLTDAGDVTTTFVDALNNITNRALACEYQLSPPPDGMKLDTAKVQVLYTPSSGDAEEVPSISSLSACAKNPNGGPGSLLAVRLA